MSDGDLVLQAVLDQARAGSGSVAEALVREVYALEERVQFDVDRGEAPTKLQRLVAAALERELLSAEENREAE